MALISNTIDQGKLELSQFMQLLPIAYFPFVFL